MSRTARAIVLALALFLALAGGWSALWHWSAGALEAALEQWRAQQRERGVQVTYLGPEIGGFPFGLDARFDAPRAEFLGGDSRGGESRGGWRWIGPPVTGSAQVWAPFTIDSRFPGLHHLAYTPREGGAELQLAAEAETANASTTLRGDGTLEQASFRLTGLRLEPQESQALEALTGRDIAGPMGPTTLALLAGRFAPAAPAAATGGDDLARIDLTAEAEQVVLPERIRLPLGQRIERAALDAVLVGDIPPGEPRNALASWRDAGGNLKVERLELVWGPLRLEAEGDASLDESFRPIGAFTARAHGLLQAVDALVREGVIESGQALAVRIAVLALGGIAGNGGAGSGQGEGQADLEVQITLQDGRLFLGPIPLFRLSPLL